MGFDNVLEDWMDEVLANYPDVYFVTELMVIQWMQKPTGTSALRDFADWKEKCLVGGQPSCNLPNACPLTTREIPGAEFRLHTCMPCPKTYPWIADPTGEGFDVQELVPTTTHSFTSIVIPSPRFPSPFLTFDTIPFPRKNNFVLL